MKFLIKLLLVFYAIELNAQTEQNYILNFNIGYNYAYEDKAENVPYGVPVELSDKEINDLTFTFTIGRKLKSNLYCGLGVSHSLFKEELNPGVNKPRYNSEIDVYFQTSNAVSKRSTYGPMAYIQYNLNLGERIRFIVSFISQYDIEKNIQEYHIFVPGMISSDDYYTTHSTFYESDRQYFKASVVPGFRINLHKNFGIDFVFGSLGYRIKTVESRLSDIKKSREFNVGFKPENWTAGLHLAF